MRHRKDRDRPGGVLASLRLDVEPPQRVDGVAEELDPNRMRRVWRKQVENASSKRKLPRLSDQVRPNKPVLDERLQQLAKLELGSFCQVDDSRAELLRARQPGEQSAYRNDQDVG